MDTITCTAVTMIMLFGFTMRSVSSNEDISKCNQKIINTCLIPLKEVDYKVATAVVPDLDEETLKDHCRRYSMFESCMNDVRPYCSTATRLIYEGIEDAYNWMCKDGFNEYITYIDCFSNNELHREGDTCNRTLTQDLQNLKQNVHLSSVKNKYICLYLEQYLDCVQNVVEAFCGAKAALWQRKLDEKSLIPILDAINCKIAKTQQKIPKSTWIPISIGASLSLSLLLIFMGVMLICLKRSKRRQNSSSSHTPAAPMAPPPYEEPVPFVVYDGHNNSMVLPVGEQDHPMPNKVDPDLAGIPVPPYTEQTSSATQGQNTRADEAVDTGYFGASASSISMPEEAQDMKAEKEEKQENEYTSLHRYDGADSDMTGISNPAYEELGAVGYFGAATKQGSGE